MAITCVPIKDADKLKAGIRRGEFDVVKMLEMSSSQRRALFAKYVSADMARFINTSFEKAMVSNRQTALRDWAENTFTGKQKSKLKDITDRIDELNELLSPEKQQQFMEDLVAEKLGITVTEEEVKTITEMSNELKSLSNELSEFNTPTLEYFEQRKKLNDYIDSITPSSKLKVATSVIGRGTLLFSIKSPITNIVGNTTIAITESLAKRMADNQYKGLNNDYAINYAKFVNKVYQQTGFDISRMTDIAEDQKVRGEKFVRSKGVGGKVEKIGQFYEDVIFKQLMGAPDVAFSSAHFADSANLLSSKMAKQEGLSGKEAQIRALEIFKDSTNINPTTIEGQNIRDRAIADAKRATYTDDNYYNKVALGFRNILNQATGNLRLGDLKIPFAKTPASVVARGIESSGITSIWDIYKLTEAVKDGDKAKINKHLRALITAGLGITAAWLLSFLINDDRFVGEYADYNPSEKKLIELEGATYDSIKIGDKWISADYFTPLAAPLIGLLNARKYGDGALDTIGKYIIGVLRQLKRIPGYNEIITTWEQFNDYTEQNKSINQLSQEASMGFIDFVSSRIIPAIISDVAKAFDGMERDVEYGTYKGQIQKIQSKIPWYRNNLPSKIDIFGTPIESENPIATLAFGARYSSGKSDLVIDELVRLNEGGNIPSLSDIRFTSSRVRELQAQIGQKTFREAIIYFGTEWKNDLTKLFNSDKYKEMSDEDKKNAINKSKSDILNKMLEKYGYKKSK
jgi:Trp operon repressor